MSTITDQNGRHRHAAGAPASSGGQFAAHRSAAHSSALQPTATPAPIPGEVRLQRWDHNDNLIEVGSVNVDFRAALDTLDMQQLEYIDHTGDADVIFEKFAEAGVITHDGPYDVGLDDEEFAAYFEERKASGSTEPVTPYLYRTAGEASGALVELTRRKLELEAMEKDARRAYVGAAVREMELPAEVRFVRYTPGVPPQLATADWEDVVELTPQQRGDLMGRFDYYGISGVFEI